MLILVLVAVSILLAGGVATYLVFGAGGGPIGPATIVSPVISGPFVHSILDDGTVESSNNVDIKCLVQTSRGSNQLQILWVIEEGTRVEQDELVVQIDSSSFEYERDQQQIACNAALAAREEAKNIYEAALEAKKEYLEGLYQQERKLIMNEVFLAEEKLRRARLSLSSGEELHRKGLVTALQLEGDEVTMQKAQNDLDLAKLKLRVIDDLTRRKEEIRLDSDIASAKAKWEAGKESYNLEKKKLSDIEQQIALCRIKAPQAGQIVYNNEYSWRGDAEFVVAPGMKVREGQVILRMPDPSQMQVKATINESRITLVNLGMPATIRLDALPGVDLKGEVIHVNQYQEPSNFFRSSVKEYAVMVKILDPPSLLRPGLTAAVDIHVERRPQATTIPVQAVLDHGGEKYCLVETSKETWETRKIAIGSNNDEVVTIESGNLSPGEMVVLNPLRHEAKLDLPKLPSGETPQPLESLDENDQPDLSADELVSQDRPTTTTPVRATAGGDAARAGEGAGARGPGRVANEGAPGSRGPRPEAGGPVRGKPPGDQPVSSSDAKETPVVAAKPRTEA